MIEQLKIRNWRIAQAIRKAQEKYKALAAAEAEMGRGTPVAPYAPLGDVEEEERKFIANVNDKQAWRNTQAHPGWDMARWKERDYAELKQWEAQQAYQRYRQQEWADPQPTVQPKPWWQRAGEWVQDKVNRFVLHPPAWLSVSYSPGPFSLGNYTIDEWVSYQPWARGGDLPRSVGYQKVSISLESTTKLTSNPSGWVDVNFANGRLTFKGKEQNGIRQDWFIQPFALSFGTTTNNLSKGRADVTTIDIDLVGTNWASFKVSQASGSTTVVKKSQDGKFLETVTTLGKVEMSVHRWPRLIVVAGGAVLVFKAGIVLAPVLVPAAPALQQIGSWLKNAVAP